MSATVVRILTYPTAQPKCLSDDYIECNRIDCHCIYHRRIYSPSIECHHIEYHCIHHGRIDYIANLTAAVLATNQSKTTVLIIIILTDVVLVPRVLTTTISTNARIIVYHSSPSRHVD